MLDQKELADECNLVNLGLMESLCGVVLVTSGLTATLIVGVQEPHWPSPKMHIVHKVYELL